jgi:hypothetical protein
VLLDILPHLWRIRKCIRVNTSRVPSAEYLLLGRGTHWDKGLSPEEIQKVMNRANAWFDRLIQQGKAKAGQPLAHEGKIVSGKKGRIVTDGPFAESKEAIAGYVLLSLLPVGRREPRLVQPSCALSGR